MPRRHIAVKNKLDDPLDKLPIREITTSAFVDLHFHGAFGIDLMTASEKRLDELAGRMFQAGIGAFCPTTLSAGPSELHDSVARLGRWIERGPQPKSAIPLGIHLEGPFINPGACGAHPGEVLRPLDLNELDELWTASRGKLKILTVAPERLSTNQLEELCRWAREKQVVLSLGHSKATQSEAKAAFVAGFSGITHAWNALPFHHREPGPLGAALGNPNLHVELILDGVHVDDTLVRWTLALHPESTCFVSDCAPAAGLTETGEFIGFGPLKCRFQNGACRLPGGALAGGGVLLPEGFRTWLSRESTHRGIPAATLLGLSIRSAVESPLKALGLDPKQVQLPKIRWSFGAHGEIGVDSEVSES